MKYSHLCIAIYCLCFNLNAHSQEWKLFSATDAVFDFKLHDDDLWVIAGSGLSKINILNGQRTNWNTVNSELPDYAYNEMAIDSDGHVWLGGFTNTDLTRFDGSHWETITSINGHDIKTIYDFKVTPDGKVWIYGNMGTATLYYFENDQFYEVPPPDSTWEYSTGTLSNIGISVSSHVWAIFQHDSSSPGIVGEFDGQQWKMHDLTSLHVAAGPGDNWVSDSHGNVYMLVTNSNGPLFLKYDGVQWNPINLPATVNDYLNQARPMYIDRLDRVWIGLWNNTFIRYDGQNWTTINLADMGLTDGFPDGIFLDKNNVQWFIYDQYSYNGRDGYLYKHTNQETNLVDLSNSNLQTNDVHNVIIDQQNNKWIGSRSGLIRYNGDAWTLVANNTSTWSPPVAPTANGGVWLSDFYDSRLTQFDGVTNSSIDLTDKEGMPYTFVREIAVDKNGKVYVATGEQEVLSFDHGEVMYFDSMSFNFFPSSPAEDLSLHVALDTAGQLYSLGYSFHRLEDDGTWTEIPLWEVTPINMRSFLIAPDGDVWIAYGISFPDRSITFKVYNGTTWSNFTSPFNAESYPKWDVDGNMWMITDEGLCKEENNVWHCYDENNSPVTPGRMADFTIDEFGNVWIILREGGILLFNEDKINHIEGSDLPTVSGCVYRDLNHNGIKDAGDTPLALHKELLLPDSIFSFSNYDGAYRFSTAPGDHVLKYIPRENWHIENPPDSYSINVNTNPISDLNFKVAPDKEITDLRLFMNEGYPRCNRIVPYWISYGNFGTNVEDGKIVFIKDPKTAFIQSQPVASTISGDTIEWLFSHQLPFSTEKIYIELKIPGPSADSSILVQNGFIDKLIQNTWIHQDSFMNAQRLSCAFDPNDKIATTKHTSDDGKTYLDEAIQYTIRFQNTGNDTAFNVVIRDTLDANLDFNTLEIIGSSHPVETYLKPDGMLEFRFINIQLPDSLVNEPRSHGFVSYIIRAKQDISSPTIIANTAHIYFDYNLAVKTNDTYVELTRLISHTYNFEKTKTIINAYPNPASSELILEMTDEVEDDIVSYAIVDVFGRKVLTGFVRRGQTSKVSISQLSPGIYFINVDSESSHGVITFIKG